MRGPTSRRAVSDAKRKRRGSKTAEAKAPASTRPSKSSAKSSKSPAVEVVVVGQVDAIVHQGQGQDKAQADEPAGRKRGGKEPEPYNEPLPFIEFVGAHPVGSVIEAEIEQFASHGAYVLCDGTRCYISLKSISDPPPRSAREVLELGETRQFVVKAIDTPRRGIDLAMPGMDLEASDEAPTDDVEAPTCAGERRADRTGPGGGAGRPPRTTGTASCRSPSAASSVPSSKPKPRPPQRLRPRQLRHPRRRPHRGPEHGPRRRRQHRPKATDRKATSPMATKKAASKKKADGQEGRDQEEGGTGKKAAAKKATAKRAGAKKATTKKAAAKKSTAKKAAAKKATAKKAAAKKSTAKKAGAKKATAKKAAAKKSTAKKAGAKKAPAPEVGDEARLAQSSLLRRACCSARRSRSSAIRPKSTETKIPSASAQRRSPDVQRAGRVRSCAPRRASKRSVNRSSWCSGVGERYRTVERAGHARLPDSDCTAPSTSSKAAAMKPPWTQPGGPS